MRFRWLKKISAAGIVFLATTGAMGRTIQGQVTDLLRSNDLGQSRIAVHILDLDDGSELASINADTLMMPASNMKLITTAAALEILGKDFKFRTRLRLIEPDDWSDSDAPEGPNGGTALVLKGDGDPALGDPVLLERHQLSTDDLIREWVDVILGTKVKQIRELIVEDRIFDRQFVHLSWPTDQLHRHYCAQVAGINFHRNILLVYPEPTTIGSTPRIVLDPYAPFIQTRNLALTDTRENFQIGRQPNSNLMTFRGTVAANRPATAWQITVHDPAILLANLLKHRLAKVGVAIEQVRRVADGELLPPGQLLYETQTTLYEVVKRANSDSQNLFAEALIKRMGHTYTGAPGSWDNGAAAVRQFLQRRLGTTAAVVTIADGSGLSRDNRITTRIMVRILKNLYKDEQLGSDYILSLAIGGERGTLKKRFKNHLKGKVYAKSGYIKGVSALSGYLLIPPNRQNHINEHRVVAFSLLFNEVQQPVAISQVKHVQDQIVALINESYHPLAAARR